MPDSSLDVNSLIARRLRELRDAQGWSLDELAERSTVSRSAISLIERAQSSPTATVLDKLAMALNVPLASLFEPGTRQSEAAPSPISRADEQHSWADPSSGYIRRNLSPSFPSPIQLVEVEFPAKQRVAYDTAIPDSDIYQQVWLIEGTMDISVGAEQWRLKRGDCLAMRLDSPIVYHNPTNKPARYLVALARLTFNKPRKQS